MKFSTNKDVNRFVRELIRRGWRYRRGGKHGELVSLGVAGFLTIPSSPSDQRTIQNLRRDVRRLVARS